MNTISIYDIFQVIKEELGFSISDLESKNRARPLSDARAMSILMAYEFGIYDVYMMAALLLRDRCTIIHLKREGINQINTNKAFALKYRTIKSRLDEMSTK